MRTVVHWFRRDLRVSDNTALHAAYAECDALVPLFVWDDWELNGADSSPLRSTFLLHSLQALEKNLAVLGHRLIVRRGSPREVVRQVAVECQAAAVYSNRDYEPRSVEVAARVSAALNTAGVEFCAWKDLVVWEGREILTATGKPYSVFTPYSRAWRARPIPPPEPRLGRAKTNPPSLPSVPPTEDLVTGAPTQPGPALPAGEHAALEALKNFLDEGVWSYAAKRDFPAQAGGTSVLSPHLRAGTINIRTILARLRSAQAPGADAERGRSVWETELIWREFFQQILANHPHVAERALRTEYDAIPWPGDDEAFEAWAEGRTGYPIVDAAMRCLNATGFMHNRLRMVVAMFLVKDLLVSWRRGETYFMRRLIDGDLAANNGGWQWCAGTGADAAPYFRIFNPVAQGLKYDPDGEFIRRWVPELGGAPAALLHEPWGNELWRARSKYPERIVQHGLQRLRCLALFQGVRKSAGAGPAGGEA